MARSSASVFPREPGVRAPPGTEEGTGLTVARVHGRTGRVRSSSSSSSSRTQRRPPANASWAARAPWRPIPQPVAPEKGRVADARTLCTARAPVGRQRSRREQVCRLGGLWLAVHARDRRAPVAAPGARHHPHPKARVRGAPTAHRPHSPSRTAGGGTRPPGGGDECPHQPCLKSVSTAAFVLFRRTAVVWCRHATDAPWGGTGAR